MYHVVYIKDIGYKLFTTGQLLYLDNARVEYSGSYDECLEYLNNVI